MASTSPRSNGLQISSSTRSKRVLVLEMIQVRSISCTQIVDADYRVSFSKQGVTQVRTYEASRAGHKNSLKDHDYLSTGE